MEVIPMAQWIPEYCVVCDKQSLQGSMYCSDKCKYMESLRKQPPQQDAQRTPQEEFSSDSSDDDDLSNFSLSTTKPLNAHTKKPSKEKNFLYASPKLNPQKNVKISPSLSPLIIPSVAHVLPSDQMPVQSVNTYKRWLSMQK